MIDVTGTVVGAEGLAQRFENATDAIRARVLRTVRTLGTELQAKVKAAYLTGQALNVRTGRLRRSVNEETTDDGAEISSSVGTNVVYGRAWELGFDGIENVKAHTRTLNGALQRVRAHTRTVHQVARPFLRPALQAMKSRILDQLAGAAQEAV